MRHPLRRETFEARLDRWLPDLEAALRLLYVDDLHRRVMMGQ